MTIRPAILCVDDDPTVLRSLKDQLRGRLGSGFLIETAESATEALEVLDGLHAEGHPIPLVIADQLMPGTSGADFLAEVHRRLPDTRNVLLTGQASTAAIGTAVNEAQLYRYIPKPWEPADLLLTVEQAVTSFDHDRELERHRQELAHLNEELERQIQQQRVLITAVQQADDAVVTTSPDWKIEFANPAFSTLTGYDADELSRQDIFILDWSTGEPGGLDEMRQTLAGGRRWRGSLTLRRKDDRSLIAKASVSPILSTSGSPSGFVWVMHDITREEELRRRSEVERKLEALGTLAGGVAHDFNNLLVPILGYATMGTDEVPGGSELHGYFTEIMEAAERAKELVQEILAFSRKRDPGNESPVDLRPITNKILARLRTVAPSEIRIEHTVPDNPVAARISEIHLHQLLTNLTNNAVHAMAEDGGTLTVRLTSGELDEGVAECARLKPEPYARLTVRDTGTGIPPEHVDKIFDPFFTTKAVGEGTGMGLSIAHGVVTSLGGTITVETGNGGTTFEVYLPLEREAQVGI